MKTRAFAALLFALALAGCTSQTTVETTTPTATVASELQLSDVTDLESAVDFADSLSASTPGLAEKMSGIAQKLPDLIVDADFPFTVNNAVNGELITLNSQIKGDPDSAASHLGDLSLIVDQIEEQLKNG